MRAVTLVCNCLHTLDVLIIAAFHFVIVSKPTNRITQESPCTGAFVESYLQDAPVTGGGMMAIHRDRSVADLKGRRTYFNHCFTASSSPHPVLHIPYYPCTMSLHILLLILIMKHLLIHYHSCTMSLHILLIYLYYPCAYPYVLAPTFNWIMQTLVHIHPKFAPIYLHFRPCRTLICMLYACYADFRALYSGWFTPPYFLCLFKQTGKVPRHTPQMTDTHSITAINRVLLDIASVVHDQLLIRNHLQAPITSPGGKRQSNNVSR